MLAYLRHVGVLEALLERGEAELLRQLLLCGWVAFVCVYIDCLDGLGVSGVCVCASMS